MLFNQFFFVFEKIGMEKAVNSNRKLSEERNMNLKSLNVTFLASVVVQRQAKLNGRKVVSRFGQPVDAASGLAAVSVVGDRPVLAGFSRDSHHVFWKKTK